MSDAARFHEMQPDLFAVPSAVRASKRTTRPAPAQPNHLRAEQTAELRRLEPVALIVGYGKPHFTMADVRTEAERLGLLTGQEGRPNPGTGRMEKPRALAFLGALLPGLARLGLVEKVTDASGRTVFDTSTRDRANGNKQALWYLTERGRVARRAAGTSVLHLREVIDGYRESGIRHPST